MTETAASSAWIDANQALLVAEFAWLRARLTGESDDAAEADARLAAARAAIPGPSAIDILVEAFALSPFERDLLLLCAGVEMDGKLAGVCAAASGVRGATFGLALAILEEAHWSALTPARALRRLRMIEVEPGHPLTAAPLRIDERILHLLAGINVLDARLQPLLTMHAAPKWMTRDQEALAETIAEAWQSASLAPVHLGGEDLSGAEDVAAAAGARLGLRVHVIGADELPAGAAEVETFMALWEREAVLLPSALLLQCGDVVPPPAATTVIEWLSAPLFVASRDPLRLRRSISSHELRKPGADEQKRLWQLALGVDGQALNGALDGVASQFRLSAQAIAAAGAAASARIAAGEPAAEAVWNACRANGRRKLDDLAERIVPRAAWDDLVLPEAQVTALRQIAAQVRRRARVYDEWGFGLRNIRGLGVSALFCGASGTGKTLAAEVLASELALDLYRIDLSSVVSKYIGETEKNLRRLFDAAENSGAILLFDEADALFGKRSEVKDSHDRYANIEVSYLLQRMEAYRGLAILTTNLKSALDTAFQRRLRFIVHFPFPDAEQREAIWQRTIPEAAPRTGLDYRRLAQLSVSGGSVRNIALNAAFLAAEAGEPIDMRHLLAAAKVESAKLERPLSATETRGWA